MENNLPISHTGSSPAQSVARLTATDFTLQTRGLSPAEVRSAFEALSAELEPIYVQMAELIRENDQLRRQTARTHSRPANEEEHDYAVSLLTQAQELADSLISDASSQARDLVLAARAHQREIVKQASVIVVPSTAEAAAESDEIDGNGAAVVHSLAKLAQTQFLAVLDALTEQVNRLGEPAVETKETLFVETHPASLPPPSRRARQAS